MTIGNLVLFMFLALKCAHTVRKVTENATGMFKKPHSTYETVNSGQRESNPHGQLGRLELYH